MVVIGISIVLLSTISYLVYRSTWSSSSPPWIRNPGWRWYPQFLRGRAGRPRSSSDTESDRITTGQGPSLAVPLLVIGDDDDDVRGGDEAEELAEKVQQRDDALMVKEEMDGEVCKGEVVKHNGVPSMAVAVEEKAMEACNAMPPPPLPRVPQHTDAALSSSREQVQPRQAIATPSTASASKLMPPPPRPQASKPSNAAVLRSPGLVATGTAQRGALNSLKPAGSTLLPPPSFSSSPRSSPKSLSASSTPPVTSSTRTEANKPRRPVILAPGHSPLDWARLINSGADLRGLPPSSAASPTTTSPDYLLIPPSILRQHNKRNDAWTALGGKVYNITPYLPYHPGGQPELMRAAGRDGTKLFMDIHSWVSWESMLKICWVGKYVSEDEALAGAGRATHANRIAAQVAEDGDDEDGYATPTDSTSESRKGKDVSVRRSGDQGKDDDVMAGTTTRSGARDNASNDPLISVVTATSRTRSIEVRWDEMD